MKKTFILFLLFFTVECYVYGQSPNVVKKIPTLTLAQSYLNPNTFSYDPSKAIELFTEEAGKGSSRAMNALGIIYSSGMGTAVDAVQAINWFEKAGQQNYYQAWNNLGMIYKNGVDVPQDFVKAVACFSKGSLLDSYYSHYLLGYMKYKGLGCPQDYVEAVRLFRKGISRGSVGSQYMLGLCFRNGYGLTMNTDSAKYWIEQAASKGYAYAKEEMEEPEPENLNVQTAESRPGNDTNEVTGVPKNGFQSVKHHVEAGADLSGTYTGYIIRYDWSGKNVIGQSKLKLKLEGDNNSLSGEWTEDEVLSAAVQGRLSDTALIFSNTRYARTDHYSAKKPALFEFRDAHLQVVKTGDTVYLAGTVQQFSLRQNEPEKPMYISLSREDWTVPNAVAEDKNSTLIISDVVVFPNPFSQSFQVRFKLKSAQKVTVYLTDLMGRTVYLQQPQLAAGEQQLVVNTDVQRGTYVLKVQYGKEVHSTVLIKQ